MGYVDENFFKLAKEFSDPKSRTVRRLRVVYAEALQAMITVMVAGQEYWAEHDFPNDQAAWNKLIADWQKRAKEVYMVELVPADVEPGDYENWGSLDPDALAEQSYQGLIKGTLGSDGIPDAALPSIMASILQVLNKYDKVLGKTWFDRLVDKVVAIGWKIDDAVDDAAEKIDDALPDAEDIKKATSDVAKVVIGGLVIYAAIKIFGSK